MKKITLSVAALAIAISSFGQTNGEKYEKQKKSFMSFEYQILDLIDAVRMDMYYGYLQQDKGMYYINEMVKLQARNRDMMADSYKLFSIGEDMTRIDNNL